MLMDYCLEVKELLINKRQFGGGEITRWNDLRNGQIKSDGRGGGGGGRIGCDFFSLQD